MSWRDELLDELSVQPCCGYQAAGTPATEPTALAAMALSAWGRVEPAEIAAGWLRDLQSPDGSVGVRWQEPTPRWATGLALLAWISVAASRGDAPSPFGHVIEGAIEWILGWKSQPLPRCPEIAHDTKLLAWPWVAGTHAWIEPTAMNVVALKAAGRAEHPRTREAVTLLLDRQLEGGGCNYGNTRVLGHQLRPHLQPTGMAMLALGGEREPSGRTERSLAYLSRALSAKTPAASLCWSLLGLSAHGRLPPQAGSWLEVASGRTMRRERSGLKMALLLLAALGEQSPLITLQPAGSREDRPGRLLPTQV